jgi:O-antigen ligase
MVAYATVCAAAVAVMLLTNWPTYQYAVRGGPIPLYFYLVPLALVVPMFFAEPGSVLRYMRDPLFWWFVVFVVTGMIWLLPGQDFLEDASRQWRLRVLSFMMFYAIVVLTGYAQRRIVAWVIVACVLLAAAFNWIDVLRPFLFVPKGIEGATEGRGAGLFINPNAAGSFIVMGVIAALPMMPSKLRGLLLITALFGVAGTFSRGAFVMVFVTLAGAVWLRVVNRAQGILLVLAVPLLLAGVGLSYDFVIDVSENRHLHNVAERLNWFKESNEEDAAVEGRRFGARQAWQMFLDSPVIGRGVGATSRAIVQEGPHNMYLMLMAEQGILGLVLYVSLWVALLRRGRRIARWARSEDERDVGNAVALLAVFLAVYGFFSHNVLEEPHMMFVLAFLSAAAFNAMRAPSRAPAAAQPNRGGLRSTA